MCATSGVPVSESSSFSSHSSWFFCCCTMDNCSLIGWHEMKTVSTLSRIISFSCSLLPIEKNPFIRPKSCAQLLFTSWERVWEWAGKGRKGTWQLRKIISVVYHWGGKVYLIFLYKKNDTAGFTVSSQWVMNIDQVCFLDLMCALALPGFCVGTDPL